MKGCLNQCTTPRWTYLQRHRWARWCTWLLVLVVCPVRFARAQDTQAVRVTDEGVLVDFQDADLRLVVAALAEAGGLNVLYTDLPPRKVTLRMQQPVPPENLIALLRSLAQSNGLKVVEEGNFLRLESEAPAAAAAEKTDSAGAPSEEVRLFVYHLKHVRAARLGGTLQAVFGGGTTSGRRPGIRETPLSESLRQPPAPPPSDNGTQVKVDMGPVRTSLPAQLHGEVQIIPDETTNSLLVRAQTQDWEVVRQAVEALDLRPLQVVIEVLIVEVRRTNEADLSVSGVVSNAKNDPKLTATLKGNTSGNLVLDVLRAGTVNLSAAISALASRGDVHVVSRPVLLAQNNQEARILIGSERPFVQVSRSLPTDAAVRDQVIQYRDVGTKLTITPTINDDGYVNLQVLQEVSTATAETQFGAPIISTREAATELFVKDGRTAVIGGLIDRQQERTRSGIPLLMDIPLLGGLFGSTHTTSSRSELFLFLTPHVIVTDEDSDRVRDSIKAKAPMLEGIDPR